MPNARGEPRLYWIRDQRPQLEPDLVPVSVGEPPGSQLFLSDNLTMLSLLQRRGIEVDLAYLDPPFGIGGQRRLSDSSSDPGQPAFVDHWPGGLSSYLDMLEPRLRALLRVLSPTGSLYLHVDPTVSHYAKVLLDEIFGRDCFQREIVWRIGWVSGYKSRARNWVRNHDSILFYTRDPRRFTFNRQTLPHPPGYERRGGGAGAGIPPDDVWNASEAERHLTGEHSLNSIQIRSFSREKTGYPTQKNLSLLRRVIAASSSTGDTVADPFVGSGTTAVAAAGMARRFVVCDRSPQAIDIAVQRLRALEPVPPFDLLVDQRLIPSVPVTVRVDGLAATADIKDFSWAAASWGDQTVTWHDAADGPPRHRYSTPGTFQLTIVASGPRGPELGRTAVKV